MLCQVLVDRTVMMRRDDSFSHLSSASVWGIRFNTFSRRRLHLSSISYSTYRYYDSHPTSISYRATFDVIFRVTFFPNLVACCHWTLPVVPKHVRRTCNSVVMFYQTMVLLPVQNSQSVLRTKDARKESTFAPQIGP
jgi:hypothetical protein